MNDEEQQLRVQQESETTLYEVLLRLSRLEDEVRELRQNTQQQIQGIRETNENLQHKLNANANAASCNELLQNEICTLQKEFQTALEESKAEVQNDIAQLKLMLHSSPTSTSTSTSTRSQMRIKINTKTPPPPLSQGKRTNDCDGCDGEMISTESESPPRGLLLSTIPSIFRRNFTSHDGLPSDTFTLMMTSPLSRTSRAWLLGICTFTFQMVLIFMIGVNQLQQSAKSSDFNVPFKVDPVVRTGQLFTIILALATQNDITSSIRFLVMFWNDPHWGRLLLKRDYTYGPKEEQQQQQQENSSSVGVVPRSQPATTETQSTTTIEWFIHVVLSNSLKFVQGILVMLITFVVIVQSDNIIDLLKDFAALMVLSEIDNIFFGLAVGGYIGSELQRKAIEAQDIKIWYEALDTAATMGPKNDSYIEEDALSVSPHPSSSVRVPASSAAPSPSTRYLQNDFCIRPTILFIITMAMVGCWLIIVKNQINGVYFEQRYPNCTAPSVNAAFELAKVHFGDGICYGGPLNTLECEFEGGDCINFNLAFPLCKDDGKTDVQKRVGDGECDLVFMNAECDFDGGDCCPYGIINDPSFGDGICDERMNTEKCGYDNGDCVDYNIAFTDCPHNVVFNNSLFGNGQCNGGVMSTEGCGFDNGDCNELRLAHPDCPLDEISQIEGADKVAIGDGLCDSGIYNIAECGYESGDCTQGQFGQTLLIRDGIEDRRRLYFSKSLSLDGTTMALGLYKANGEGRFDLDPPGLVQVWRYNDIETKWIQLGDIMIGDAIEDQIGLRMTLSSSGGRIALSYRTRLKVYGLRTTSSGDIWSQIGQTLVSNMDYAIGTMTTDGQRIALFHSQDEIQVYDLESFTGEYRWMDNVHEVINPSIVDRDITPLPLRVELKFNSLDGSRLLLGIVDNDKSSTVTKIFQCEINRTPKTWIQIGQSIESPHSSLSAEISADGKRIAVPSNSTSNDAPGEVNLYDYDTKNNKWTVIGDAIKHTSPRNGDGYGYRITMGLNGKFLAILGQNTPSCQRYPNEFQIDDCSRGSIQFYVYERKLHRFKNSLPKPDSSYKDNGNIINLTDLSDSTILGLHLSMSEDGRVLSVSGYNTGDEIAFIQTYHLDQLLYRTCVVDEPDRIGDGICLDRPPYNTPDCGFDGGDCDQNPVEGYPDCFVHHAFWISDGNCKDHYPYNTEVCGFDGGDCIGSVQGYPNCFVPIHTTNFVGDGHCDNTPPYNTSDCGFDGGDCL